MTEEDNLKREKIDIILRSWGFYPTLSDNDWQQMLNDIMEVLKDE